MADDGSLVSILAGTDPLSPQILEALHAEQARSMVSNSANWQNQGLAGGLARAIAGFAAPSAAPQVADITAQRTAARPELAQLLASPDPYKAAAENPNVNPLNLAAIIGGANPGSVAEARLKAADAALARLNVSGFTNQQNGVGAPAVGISAPAVRNVAPPAGGGATAPRGSVDISTLTTGRPVAPSDASQPADPLAGAGAMSPQQRATIIQNPQQRSIILQKLRALATQRQASASSVPSLGRTAPPT